MNTRKKKDDAATLKAFGERLRSRRQELELTMEELAKACGARSRQIVERWEHGKHYPTTCEPHAPIFSTEPLL
jgi:ribosome-binding protein aMBF1 (putative translation factor)